MLLDVLIIGGLVYGAAKLLNATAFKATPAAAWIAWSLTVVSWVVSFFGLFFGRVLAYQSIAAEVGVPSLASSGPKPNFFLPFLFAWLFFITLNRKLKAPPPTAQADPTASPVPTKIEPSPPVSPAGDSAVVARLKELQQLRDRGILTEAEYQFKLKATLNQA